jgi:hypothetical protein
VDPPLPSIFPSTRPSVAEAAQYVAPEFWIPRSFYSLTLDAYGTIPFFEAWQDAAVKAGVFHHDPSGTLVGGDTGCVWVVRALIKLVLNLSIVRNELPFPANLPDGYDPSRLATSEWGRLLQWCTTWVEAIEASTAVLCQTSEDRLACDRTFAPGATLYRVNASTDADSVANDPKARKSAATKRAEKEDEEDEEVVEPTDEAKEAKEAMKAMKRERRKKVKKAKEVKKANRRKGVDEEEEEEAMPSDSDTDMNDSFHSDLLESEGSGNGGAFDLDEVNTDFDFGFDFDFGAVPSGAPGPSNYLAQPALSHISISSSSSALESEVPLEPGNKGKAPMRPRPKPGRWLYFE